MTKEKKRRGRKELINDELIGVITKAIKVGAHTEIAAAFAGINVSTFYKWIKRGRAEITRVTETPRAKYRKSEAKYVELIHEIDHALVVCEVRDILTTFKASQDGDWKAAAWRLEHRHKDRWGASRACGPLAHHFLFGVGLRPLWIHGPEAIYPRRRRWGLRELVGHWPQPFVWGGLRSLQANWP